MKTAVIGVIGIAAYAAFGQGDVTFRVQTRLVEVYATVRDQHGRYLDGLPQDRFQVKDNGAVQPVVSFESNAAKLSCAILLDTTGSMAATLPAVKKSVMAMIDDLHADDSVAVYSFSIGLKKLADFTTDKDVAKQAVLRSHVQGQTALFDAIAELAREIEPRSGKKAIVVFTDGDDNASLLNARSAVQRAKKSGVPVYAIAEGEALKSKVLLDQIRDIADATGAKFHEAHKMSEIGAIFQDISGDLGHTYVLAYKPPPANDQKWRAIELAVLGEKGVKVRAKEGYYPE